jgi:hypothetical protein
MTPEFDDEARELLAYGCIPCKRVFERGDHHDRHALSRLKDHKWKAHQGDLSGEDVALIYDGDHPWDFVGGGA